MGGRYVGAPPQVELGDDGRTIKLLADFGFVDDAGLSWSVPRGAVADGASIPRAFWTLIGGPLEGRYRNASIVHDWYCDRRTRTWQATHKVFHEAMLVSGVDPRKAKLMYFAVRWQGPRWEERVSLNTNLNVGVSYNFGVGGGGIGLPGFQVTRKTVKVRSPGETKNAADAGAVAEGIAGAIERGDLSIGELEKLADRADPLSALAERT